MDVRELHILIKSLTKYIKHQVRHEIIVMEKNVCSMDGIQLKMDELDGHEM
jgi:hypothetical protein